MADGESGEKTEPGTGKRRETAREDGNVAKSQEVTSAILLLVGMTIVVVSGGHFVRVLGSNTSYLLSQAHILGPQNQSGVREMMSSNLQVIILALAPLLAGVLIAGLGANIMQVGLKFSSKSLAFKAEKLNPIPGFKKFFQSTAYFEAGKNVLKISLIGILAWLTIRGSMDEVVALPLLSLSAIVAGGKLLFIKLMAKLLFLMALIGLIDWFFQKHKYEENIKMTKQEVKQENKDIEGDPQIKARIRGLQMEMSRKRMLADVPTADVIITNPTHYAVALKYVSGSPAPIVVAKGQDNLAQMIKKIGRKYRVPVIENKPLARGIYRQTEIGQMIPESLFQAVAEVLAYIYRLKKA
ncbi:MAG: flagellar biosynthetic protein FlhB [Candidatus Krumholzibacteriia bacterium]|jgi:flagellar biosynthetic protein FlhB